MPPSLPSAFSGALPIALQARRSSAFRWIAPLLLLLGLPVLLEAQAPTAWNDARVVDAIARARAARQEVSVDSAFLSYRADARGFVYFFIDRPGTDERTLIKADQIAIELYWRAPDQVRQRIVGLRDEKVLPTNIRYHLDHLTVVQDEFGDVIRLGDGDEVSTVVHPVAPGSDGVYDFRLTDSLTISFPGSGSLPVRVYQVQVRPKDFTQPGFVGTLFLDRDNGAIVRMNFTFTPASYVDQSLDYIRISLDNALWDGKYWLPYRQEAELRRELPELDFVGSVIRGRFEIGEYDINADIPDVIFRTFRVTAAPPEERRAFPFERPLFADLDAEGLSPPPSLEEIRRQAREIAEGRYLSGLSRLRVHVPSASDLIRYNRAEGLFAGVGALVRPLSGVVVRGQVGYGFARGQLAGSLRIGGSESATAPELLLQANHLRDLGPVPGAAGLVNSLSAASGGPDYLDPFFATGARATLPLRLDLALFTATISVEQHRSAALAVRNDPGLRPIRPIEEGLRSALSARGEIAPVGSPWRFAGNVTAAALEDRRYLTLGLESAWNRDAAWHDLGIGIAAQAGAVTSQAPPQELFLLGGRETLLGHPYREFVGDRFWLARTHVSRTLVSPWLTGRVFLAAGQTALHGRSLPPGWEGDGGAGVKATAGLGLAVAWDILQVDLGRGLSGGRWGLAVGASRRFRSWM